MPELDPGLVLTGNATYIDAVYTDFKSGNGYDPATGVSRSDLDFTGNRIVRTPKWSGALGLVQVIDSGADGEIELGIDVTYNSGFYWTPQNVSFVKEDDYSLLDARVAYRYIPWDIRVTLFGTNLTDKRYHDAQFQTDFGNGVTLAYPRQYGLRVNWNF